MTRTQDIDAALRSLDPADHHVDATGYRASADLEAILATEPAADRGRASRSRSGTPAGRPRRPARGVRQVALAGALVAAATTGMVALPSLTGGDEAFATWTGAPEGMSAQQRAEAADGCRASLEEGAGADLVDDLARAQSVIAERRGLWTTVVLAGTDGFSAMCITDDSASLFADGMIGSIGTPAGHAAPGPRDLTATDLGVGTMGAGDISLAAGTAGEDVAGVVYRSPVRGDVAATVSQGRFALWLPGDELADAPSRGVDVDVSYRDGSTRTHRLTF